MPDRTVRARIYTARRIQRDASRKRCNPSGILCAHLIEVIGLYNICRNIGGGPSRFGVIELQTCSIVQCASTYSEYFSLELSAVRLRAKFELSSFNRSRDISWSQNSKIGSRDPHMTLFDPILNFYR